MITTKIDLKKKVKLMSERQLWIIIIEFTDNTWGGPSSSGRSALCQTDRWTAVTLRLQLECLSCTRLIFITCLLPLRFFSTADSFSLNNNAVRCYTTLLDSLNAAAIKYDTWLLFLKHPSKATGQTSCQKHQQWQGAGLAFTCQIHVPVTLS